MVQNTSDGCNKIKIEAMTMCFPRVNRKHFRVSCHLSVSQRRKDVICAKHSAASMACCPCWEGVFGVAEVP